jgi:hypothetical protein
MNINKENNPTIEQRIERKLQEAEIPGREVEFDPDEAVVGRVNPEQGAWNTGWNFRSSDGRLPTTERRR